MSTLVHSALELLVLTVGAMGLVGCCRELRAIRRGLGALDKGQGRRAAVVSRGLRALREPLDTICAGVEGLSLGRRDTTAQPGPPLFTTSPPPPPESAGLRLNLPRAVDEDRDSDGETRLVRQPTAAELAAAGAVRPARSVREAPAGGTLRSVCRMCDGSGSQRMQSGGLGDCGGCQGSGYLDPAAPALNGSDDRRARLPGNERGA
jgi:hypothetical protein